MLPNNFFEENIIPIDFTTWIQSLSQGETIHSIFILFKDAGLLCVSVLH